MIEENQVYKPIIRNFMGIADVRVIQVDNQEYVVCKDMFDCLGLTENGKWSMPKQKMLEFLEIINKECECKSFALTSKTKKSKSREVQEVECLNIETVPIVLTQFKPTARRGEQALKTWSEFMKFVDDLLQYHELHKYIFQDKDNQKNKMQELHDLGGKEVITNQMVNKIMGELILIEEPKFAIKKDELKIYQPNISIDLLEVRNFVMEKFINAYEILNSHSEAYEHVLKITKKKYGVIN